MPNHGNNETKKSDKVRIELVPLGAVVEVERGTLLQALLSSHGMEFPCGGLGTCGGCRVQVLDGHVEPTPEEEAILTREELLDGWRMACYMRAETPLKLKVEQWTMPVLVDDTQLARTHREGLAIAIDLGTTTLVAQLLDLASGKLLGFRTALNPQASEGADIMSRVRFAFTSNALTPLIRNFIGDMLHDLASGREHEVEEIVLVGNTVMHHLFCGLDTCRSRMSRSTRRTWRSSVSHQHNWIGDFPQPSFVFSPALAVLWAPTFSPASSPWNCIKATGCAL